MVRKIRDYSNLLYSPVQNNYTCIKTRWLTLKDIMQCKTWPAIHRLGFSPCVSLLNKDSLITSWVSKRGMLWPKVIVTVKTKIKLPYSNCNCLRIAIAVMIAVNFSAYLCQGFYSAQTLIYSIFMSESLIVYLCVPTLCMCVRCGRVCALCLAVLSPNSWDIYSIHSKAKGAIHSTV